MVLKKLKVEAATYFLLAFYLISTMINPFFHFPYIRLIGDFILFGFFFAFVLNVFNKKVKVISLDMVLFLFLLYSFAGLFWAKFGSMIFLIKGFYVGYFPILAYFWGRFVGEKSSKKFIVNFSKLIVIWAIVSVFWGIRQYFFPFSKEISYSFLPGTGGRFYGDSYIRPANKFRVFSFFISSVHFAQFLLLSQVLLFYLYVTKKIEKRFYVIFSVLIFIGILLTFSRTILITYFILMVFILILSFFYEKIFSQLVVFFLLIFILMGLVRSQPLIKNRLKTIKRPKKISSLKTRLSLWEKRKNDFLKKPLFGYGTGIAGFHMRRPREQYLICDNYYLKILIELGIVGFLFWTVIYLFIIKKFLTFRKNAANLLLLYNLILLIPMYTNQVLEAFPSNILFFFVLGVVFSVPDNEKRENQEEKNEV